MLLEITNLSGGYKGVGIVEGVSFSMAEGDTLALLGRNGVGKTTLLRTIVGLADRTRGDVVVAGTPVAGRSPAALARLGVTFVPDTRGLFARLTVAENIRLARLHAYAQSPVNIFEFFPDLGGRLNQTAGTLSGGLQQQVAIARALSTGARLLIVDELTQGLQPSVVQLLVAALRRAASDLGLSILLVDQNPQLAMSICSNVMVMDHGRIAIAGASDALSGDDRLTDLLVV